MSDHADNAADGYWLVEFNRLTVPQLEARLEWARALGPEVINRDELIAEAERWLRLRRGLTDGDMAAMFTPAELRWMDDAVAEFSRLHAPRGESAG